MGRGERLLPPDVRKDFENWMRFGTTYCPGNYSPDKKYEVTLRA